MPVVADGNAICSTSFTVEDEFVTHVPDGTSAELRSTAFPRAGNAGPPSVWRKRSDAPPAWGAAMLVPEKDIQVPLVCQNAFAERMFDPGATMSGLIRPSCVGP